MASVFKPDTPKPLPPPPLPDPSGPAAMEAARKARAGVMQGGRSSTVLTGGAGTIAGGGMDYGGTKLGGA